MANAVYPKAVEAMATGLLDYDTAVIKAVLLRGATFNAAHTFLSDLTAAGATVASTSAALTGKTAADGVLDAADSSFPTVAAGTACNAVVVVQSSAPTGGADLAATAQRLVSYHDQGTGLPVTPSGVTIPVTWSDGPERIARV